MTYTLAQIAAQARKRGEHDLAERCEHYLAAKGSAIAWGLVAALTLASAVARNLNEKGA